MKPKKNKSCGKTVYETMGDAVKGAKNTNYIRRKQKDAVGKLMPYRCERCGKFHLTSKNPKEYKQYLKLGMTDEELKKIKKKKEEEKELTLRDLLDCKGLNLGKE